MPLAKLAETGQNEGKYLQQILQRTKRIYKELLETVNKIKK